MGVPWRGWSQRLHSGGSSHPSHLAPVASQLVARPGRGIGTAAMMAWVGGGGKQKQVRQAIFGTVAPVCSPPARCLGRNSGI